jgi:hypothetical protein
MSDTPEVEVSWPKIILIMVITAVVVGMSLGALDQYAGIRLPGGGAAIGAAVGAVGGLLIGRRVLRGTRTRDAAKKKQS